MSRMGMESPSRSRWYYLIRSFRVGVYSQCERAGEPLIRALRNDVRFLILLRPELDAEVELELLDDRTNSWGTWTKMASPRVEVLFGRGTREEKRRFWRFRGHLRPHAWMSTLEFSRYHLSSLSYRNPRQSALLLLPSTPPHLRCATSALWQSFLDLNHCTVDSFSSANVAWERWSQSSTRKKSPSTR